MLFSNCKTPAAHHEHHLLVDYVEARDLERFTELTRSHIQRSMENCLTALAEQKQNREETVYAVHGSATRRLPAGDTCQVHERVLLNPENDFMLAFSCTM